MKKFYMISALALLAASLPAQDAAETEDVTEYWVADLAALAEDKQSIYTINFAAAKRAYSRSSFSECTRYLDVCESIYDKNPNVWNLRASVLIARQEFDAAVPFLEKVRDISPDDMVVCLNYSLLHMGAGRYEESVDELDVLLDELKYKPDMQGLYYSLLFRKFLCLLMLDKTDAARALVEDITPMVPAPVYYYCQSVFAVVAGDRNMALREMHTADSIYAQDAYLNTYKQNIKFSGLLQKYTLSK